MRPCLSRTLGVLVTLALMSPAFGEAQHTPPQEFTGPWWVAQPTATRHDFVRGWTDGYVVAWLSAEARLVAVAEQAGRAVPPDRKVAAALLVSATVLRDGFPDYGKSPAYYVDQLTTFFARYADLRDCPIGLVLKGLDSRDMLSLEEIAQWLREIWPR